MELTRGADSGAGSLSAAARESVIEMSVAHTEEDLAFALEVFTSFLAAVVDPSRIDDGYDYPT